ncbi:N-6 DNA methylase [Clostridium perfringens]|nr:N-6 DNA methylase [Clostridium perfringens]
MKSNFPVNMQTTETADLFMALILYRLKHGGRVGVVLSDGFLFGTDNAKTAIKEKLLKECNLHTIVRLPKGVFEPYTDIPTNLLFFEKTGPTKDVWYFEHPLPAGYKNYTKTKPIKLSEFKLELDWWNNREENKYAWKVSIDDIVNNQYNLDIKNPNTLDRELSKSSLELLEDFKTSYEKVASIINLLEKGLVNE